MKKTLFALLCVSAFSTSCKKSDSASPEFASLTTLQKLQHHPWQMNKMSYLKPNNDNEIFSAASIPCISKITWTFEAVNIVQDGYEACDPQSANENATAPYGLFNNDKEVRIYDTSGNGYSYEIMKLSADTLLLYSLIPKEPEDPAVYFEFIKKR